MGRTSIRTGQLISTFGPGSLMVDRYGTSLIICGLDHWFKQEPDTDGVVNEASHPDEFRFSEWRLEEALQTDYFMRPPDFRIPQLLTGGADQKPNVNLHIPALRFPSYFVCNRQGCRTLRKAEFHIGRKPKCPKCSQQGEYSRLNQVRFISICPKGHINDFPWRDLLGCTKGDECGRMTLHEQGSSDLASIRVKCECGRSESMSGVTNFERDQNGVIYSTLSEKIRKAMNSDSSGQCSGMRLWHGPGAVDPEPCGEDIIATFPNATNVYYSKTRTSIFVPKPIAESGETDQIRTLLDQDSNESFSLKNWWAFDKSRAVGELCNFIGRNADSFDSPEKAKQGAATFLEHYFGGIPIGQENAAKPSEPEAEETAFRRVEFNVLRQANDERDIRTVAAEVPDSLGNHFDRVLKVERLRETRILYGFDRFMVQPDEGSPAELGEKALRQLFATVPQRPLRWLPGSVVFGEGLYLELQEGEINNWLTSRRGWLEERLTGVDNHNFAGRVDWPAFKIAPPGRVSEEWIARYLLVHTTAHIIINQLVFECGYSTASLRERLYVSADPAAPQAGILIYTSAGDSEGTLGGLVRLGEPERFEGVVLRALQRASWCSADPVCSEVANRNDDNLAACHSCVLLPETSCENFNRALDRTLVVGSPADPDRGFFSCLLNGVS